MVCQDISPDEEWLVLLKTVVQFYFTYGVSKSLASAFEGIGRIVPDEERLVLLKPIVQFYFTYDASRGFLHIRLNKKYPFNQKV